ncbi:PTS transporter subunit EIIC [Paenibacillus sp. DCT19]|uniref:PTS transporter subunit EIIC n=1 Tax=Paenibacillus sp. DCT19 TaxID=2211212 RepID=UPI000FE18D15|nr:PTS transporter subunit EIIC [Paenibacillus sp. DCT19]
MNNKETAQQVIKLLGGRENITTHLHCVTRLRFNVKDDSKTVMDEIKSVPGVMGTAVQNGQYQVIIGTNVEQVFNEVDHILKSENLSDQNAEPQISKPQKRKISLNAVLDVISGIFAPILPALVAGGILKGIIAIILSLGWVSESSSTLALFNLISDIPFYFLPFLLAVSSARKFKVNDYLGICMAGALLYPSFVDALTNEDITFSLFNLTIPVFNYANSVFPVILGVGLMALIYRAVDKFTPSVLKMVVVPSVTLIVAVPIALFIIAPIGAYGGIYLADGIVWLFDTFGIFAGFLLGFLTPLIVLTGMHQSTSPIQIQNISSLGYDYLLPISFVHNMAESGAALGAALRMKDKKVRSAALSTSFSAFLGISEPAMYTVNFVHKTPFVSAMVASGIGGSLTVIFGVKCFAFVMPGVTSLPVYADPKGGLMNLFLMVVSVLATFVIGFIISYLTGYKIGRKVQ